MMHRTWVILGATSIIAEQFAHFAAKAGHHLRLVGRNPEQLDLIARDIRLRYRIPCEIMLINFSEPSDQLITILNTEDRELDLFIAHSDFADNEHLNYQSIKYLVNTNITSTAILINAYLQSKQEKHHILYLSSVAACRGRAKNSLYGASKAAIEVFLQGLQQQATKSQKITIARLGYIDTRQTYGLPGIFYTARPYDCAKACWKKINHKKELFYYPGFWRIIMTVIAKLPSFIYKKMGKI
ncbi:short-chain dehydrogenase [Legionella norrlandica]|uniref:Short-chain dehydrogenase n=1 Tax=Legionella norrlandica TaxID=1498499 RepID=A0A0A2SSA0_9GAMM|nr:SDR family NAD(P)-dependent oxidoreductase [Legionella norrlandica]KGP62611.1 short-chain dehydrogenase [Legionella norrlandica]